MANTVTLKFIVDDDGTLRALGNDADVAADKTENVGRATENLNKRKKRFNKVEKGVAQATSNTTKGFAKQTGAVNGGLVPAYAVLASNVFALSAAFNFLKRAFDVQALESSQVAFAANTGTALGALTQRLREASDGMLGFQEAGQAAAIGLAKGFSPKQLEDLADGARKASTALGRDFQDSFDRLVRGASKAEPELLDELGITLRLENATRRYAQAIGKNRDELNDYQRSQAVLIETQRQLNENFGDVEAITNPFIKLQKTFEDLVKNLTGAVMPVLQSVVDIINRSTGAAVAVFGLIGVNILKSMLPFDEFSQKFEGFFSKSVEGFKRTGKQLIGFGKDIRTVNAEIRATRQGALKSAARAAIADGGTGKILQKMKKGMALTPQEKGIIKKAIRDAEADYRKFGEVTTQIFKGVNIAIVRDVGMALKQTEMGAVSARRTFGRVFKGIQLGAKLTGKALILGLKAPLVAIGAVAKATGFLISKAMSFAGFIGIFMIIKEAVEEIIAKPASIAISVAKGIDTVLSFLAVPINEAGRLTLALADSVVNTFNDMSFSVKTTFHNIASSILGVVDTIINGIVDGVNSMRAKINEFLPDSMKNDPIEFRSALKDGLGAAPVKKELSNMEASFKGFSIVSGNAVENFVRSTETFSKLEGMEESADKVREAEEALKKFNEQSEALGKSVGAISQGLVNTEDAAKRSMSIANAIRTLDISSAFEAINRTRNILDEDGKIIGQELILSPKQQRDALQQLQEDLKGIINISPQLKRAFDEAIANPANITALENLETAAGDASGASGLLKAEIDDLGAKLADTLGKGDFNKALSNLESLESLAETSRDGFLALEDGAAGAAKVMNDFENATGNAALTTSQLITKVRELVIANELNKLSLEAINALDGDRNSALKMQVKLTAETIKLEGLLLTLRNATDLSKEKEEELRLEIQLLKIRQARLKAEEGLATISRIGKIAGSASLQGIGTMAGDVASLDMMKDLQIQTLERALTEGKMTAEAATTELEAIMKRYNEAILLQTFAVFDNLANDFAKLGPEGQFVSSAVTGISNVTQSLVGLASVMADGTSSEKMLAGIAVVSTALSAISEMQNNASAARVKAIDEEIAAEKKRDGKSAASVARINALEKKKEAEKKKAFEMNKKMMMAQVVMNTAAAVSAATVAAANTAAASGAAAPVVFGLTLGMLKGIIVAMGAAQLALIASTSFQGGGSGVGGGGGPTSISIGKRRGSVDIARSQGARGELAYMRGESGTGGPENFRPAFGGYRNRAEGGNTGFMVGEQGPELFVPERPGRIVPSDDIVAGGSSNVTFNINTIDATGVEDILTQQRGNIIGMVREAANSYGQDFIEEVDTTVFTQNSTGVSRY